MIKIYGNKKIVLMLIFAFFASIAIILCNANYSLANEPNNNDKDVLVERSSDGNYWHYERTEYHKEELLESLPGFTNVNYEFAVEQNLLNKATIYIQSDDDSTCCFDFPYDYRGYIANSHERDYRYPRVQYFFNSQTNELAILKTDEQDSYGDYGTINYLWDLTTNILATELNFDHAKDITISDHVKTVYLDPDLEFIGKWSLKNLVHCECVDICNHCYKHCRLGDSDTCYPGAGAVRDSCFKNIGKDLNKKVSLPFLNQFAPQNQKTITDDFDSHGFTNAEVYFDPNERRSFFTYEKDENIEKIFDNTGKEVKDKIMCIKHDKDDSNPEITVKVKHGFQPEVCDAGGYLKVTPKDKINGYFSISLTNMNYSKHHIRIIANKPTEVMVRGSVFTPFGNIDNTHIVFENVNGLVISEEENPWIDRDTAYFCLEHINIGFKGRVHAYQTIDGCKYEAYSDILKVNDDMDLKQIDLHKIQNKQKVEFIDVNGLVGKILDKNNNLLDNNFYVFANNEITFKLVLSQPWLTPNVLCNGVKMDPDSNGFYHIDQITDDIKIEIKI